MNCFFRCWSQKNVVHFVTLSLHLSLKLFDFESPSPTPNSPGVLAIDRLSRHRVSTRCSGQGRCRVVFNRLDRLVLAIECVVSRVDHRLRLQVQSAARHRRGQIRCHLRGLYRAVRHRYESVCATTVLAVLVRQ